MNWNVGWSRRTFLSALAALGGNTFAPKLHGEAIFGGKASKAASMIDGHPIVPITSGLGSTGDIYAELGVTPLVNINGHGHGHWRLGDEA